MNQTTSDVLKRTAQKAKHAFQGVEKKTKNVLNKAKNSTKTKKSSLVHKTSLEELITYASMPDDAGAEAIKTALSQGSNPSLADENGKTAIDYALEHENLESLYVLYSKHPDQITAANEYATPIEQLTKTKLKESIENNDFDVTRKILSYCEDSNQHQEYKSYSESLIKTIGEEITNQPLADLEAFLNKKPLLGSNIIDDTGTGFSSQALSIAIDHYNSNPKILHKVIDLIKEENKDNLEVLNILTQELVRFNNNMSSIYPVLEIDREIQKLKHLGAAVTNEYLIDSLSEEDKMHLSTIAGIVYKKDTDVHITNKIENVINSSLDDLPEKEELIALHHSIQKLEPHLDTINKDLASFIRASTKEITENFLKSQISELKFQEAVSMIEVAKNSPGCKYTDEDKEEGSYIENFIIGYMESYGTECIKESPQKFLGFLQKEPLLNFNINNQFINRALHYAVENLKYNPGILDSLINSIKEHNPDNDLALKDLTDEIINFSNKSNNKETRTILNSKISEYLGEYLSTDGSDLRKIINSSTEAKNSELLNIIILNNNVTELFDLEALKLLHNSKHQDAQEKLLQNPNNISRYLAAAMKDKNTDPGLVTILLSKTLEKEDQIENQPLSLDPSVFKSAVLKISTGSDSSERLDKVLSSSPKNRYKILEVASNDISSIASLSRKEINEVVSSTLKADISYNPENFLQILGKFIDNNYRKNSTLDSFFNQIATELVATDSEIKSLKSSEAFNSAIKSCYNVKHFQEKRPIITKIIAWFNGKSLDQYKYDQVFEASKKLEASLFPVIQTNSNAKSKLRAQEIAAQPKENTKIKNLFSSKGPRQSTRTH